MTTVVNQEEDQTVQRWIEPFLGVACGSIYCWHTGWPEDTQIII